MWLTTILLIGRLLFPGWGTDFEKARDVAKQEHKYILLNFSGSDWCGPCIKLHEQVFESQLFKEMAGNDLVLINADFPRLKKNQLPKEKQQQNDHLADLYNAKGSFPLTVLLTADGKLVKAWEGFPANGPEEFVREVKAACHAGN